MTALEIALAAVDEALGLAVQKRFVTMTDDPKPLDEDHFKAAMARLAISHAQARHAVSLTFKES